MTQRPEVTQVERSSFERIARRPLIAGTAVMAVALTLGLGAELSLYGVPVIIGRLATITTWTTASLCAWRRWTSFPVAERIAWAGGLFISMTEVARVLDAGVAPLSVALTIQNTTTATMLITYIVWRPARARRLAAAMSVAAIIGAAVAVRDEGLGGALFPLLSYPLAIMAMCEGVVARTRVALADAAAARAEAVIGRTDQLTGLPNRRGLLPGLAAMAPGDAILLIDVDHFKAVNDEHGHDVGDAVLRRLAAILADGVRDHDSIARWGGEEFVVLTGSRPGDSRGAVTPVDAEALAERLCTAVRDDEREPGVTVSIGAGWMHDDDTDWQDAIRRADQCMYDAKRAGRDRYVVGAPPDGEAHDNQALDPAEG